MEGSDRWLEKITAFVTREGPAGLELLVFRHPHAGIQLPAGTVDEGETHEQAVLREVREETGLENVRVVRYIGTRRELPPGATHVVLHAATVYARPNPTSFDWARLPRGASVRSEQEQGEYRQVTYIEYDRVPDPQYISYQITGWVPESALASSNLRHFYHLALTGRAPDEWEQFADQHLFRLFWSPLVQVDALMSPQDEWLAYVTGVLGYTFLG
jgi:8-oxo-dGTP pyrophosphatase MutT (NUDIX family)